MIIKLAALGVIANLATRLATSGLAARGATQLAGVAARSAPTGIIPGAMKLAAPVATQTMKAAAPVATQTMKAAAPVATQTMKAAAPIADQTVQKAPGILGMFSPRHIGNLVSGAGLPKGVATAGVIGTGVVQNKAQQEIQGGIKSFMGAPKPPPLPKPPVTPGLQ